MASGRSRIEVWNSALDVLKEAPLNDPGDDDPIAKWLSRNYAQQRDYLLGRYYWKFAMARTEIPAASSAPTWGWSASFAIPPNCLRIVPPTIDGSWNGHPVLFEEEGGYILCNIEGAMRLRYVKRVEQEGLFSNDFCEVLSLRLAMAMSHWMTGKQSMTQQIRDMYSETFAEVKDAATVQVAAESYYDSDILDERVNFG